MKDNGWRHQPSACSSDQGITSLCDIELRYFSLENFNSGFSVNGGPELMLNYATPVFGVVGGPTTIAGAERSMLRNYEVNVRRELLDCLRSRMKSPPFPGSWRCWSWADPS